MDAETAIQYIFKNNPSTRLYLHGSSMGAAVAIASAVQYPSKFSKKISGLILDNTFASIPGNNGQLV